jgi:cytochrome c553
MNRIAKLLGVMALAVPMMGWHLPQSRPPPRQIPPRARRCTRKAHPIAMCRHVFPATAPPATVRGRQSQAGWPASRIRAQATGDFKAKSRDNAIMSLYASALNDQDMKDIGAYLAKQQLKPATAKNKDTIEVGQKIYRGGIAAKGVPACAGCHGPTGAGIPAQYPRIGGQYSEYTEAQLVAFRQGTRKNNSVMSTIAAQMSDAEIKAVADYVAGVR